MTINKIKNMSSNVISGFVYRIISILFPFVIRTIIINVLSSEYLGLSSLFTSVLQALNLMELGLGSALVFNMYEHVANNNIEKLCNYMSFYKKCYRIIGISILIIGLLCMPFLECFINGDYPKDINIYLLYITYLLNTVVSYLLFAYKNSIALAYQRTDVENKALTVSQMLMYILQILFLILTKNYYIYVILLPIFTIIKNLIISHKIDVLYPKMKPSGDISKEEKKKIINNIKALFGHQIAFTIINSADNIILSKMLNLNELAIYNNYYYVMSALINIMTIIFNSIQAGIGNNIIVDESDVVFENYKKFRTFIYLITCIFSVCMFCAYQPFMKLWMGEKYLLPYYATIAFSFGLYITQIRRVITTYKNAAGLWKQDFWKPYIWIFFDILLDFILIPKIGVSGAIVATALSALVIAIPCETIVLYKNIFKRSYIEHFIFMLKEFIIYAICISICWLLINSIHFSEMINFVFSLFIGFIIPIIVNLIFKINNKEIKWMFQRFKILIKEKL